eukprot:CAMPEP_0119560744 /NCGR_PEP_ID=MMETSP1352-20130426/15735_1 /TAXON_ID=265584 /ORGANISM="Stauroneis constricta, Strain CCMP1120" /LENGTH=167 /DNA_ID=CAMNT_0007608793 /DNA_START=103 /DNA_END=606 /DNA_ORIENTATION=+
MTTTLTKSKSPATAALNAALRIASERTAPSTLGASSALAIDNNDRSSGKPMIVFNSNARRLKRQREIPSFPPSLSFCGGAATSFDMSTLLAESVPIEDDIRFPTIEWDNSNPFDDDDDGAADNEDTVLSRPSKRRCSGLSRTKKVLSDLSILSMAMSPRQVSSDSLC